ncbi:MAG: Nramp family divalent metal transporter [Thermoanaerobaculia bacterium]
MEPKPERGPLPLLAAVGPAAQQQSQQQVEAQIEALGAQIRRLEERGIASNPLAAGYPTPEGGPRPLGAALGPGLLVAATGVGAGDLATASIAGSKLGPAVLWAVVLGALVKLALTEGLARWQLATGETLVAGTVRRLGRPVALVFLVYLLVWSVFVGRALVSACGVTAQALAPVFVDPVSGKIVFGAAHSLAGIILVLAGGYRLFERVMSFAIGLMFVTVVVTAILLRPELGTLVRGLFVPSIPDLAGDGLVWTVALLGGVGGTVTLLCYGYWIREEGCEGPAALALCRIDLASGYAMTALFGLAMVTIGSTVRLEGGGAMLLVQLGDRLGESLGAGGRWLFLLGAWGAVASSLLGVWQSIPYLFADLWRLLTRPAARAGEPVDTRGLPYRGYLVALGLVSIGGLFSSFVQIQKIYAVVGALFIPLLALALLVLNGRAAWVGREHRNGPLAGGVLIASLALFAFFGYLQLR